ncbi:hypothetical protein FE697_002525 [Mumia zhuanghuii]|uniref:Uncharacterized protein n=2 Tax=Mumia TaxID=1546255 RepID=A0ABW1QGT5_9ACTN|nr:MULTISPECIES: hypothetical protein [Mumia]KAA1424810.1 hypothetical protein FE697_002525 [Mumia zhuanghuii]
MDRKQLKSRRVAAQGYGNACFLDEGDETRADAVVFTPLDGAWTVFATDAAAAPIEATRRSFATDSEALDYMYRCLRDKVEARHAEVSARVDADAATEARKGDPEQMVLRTLRLLDAYRGLGLAGVLTTLAFLATAVGWIGIAPFTDAEKGLPFVAVCYSLATANVVAQWWRGRHVAGRRARRALRTAVGTALFAVVALVCMVIRLSDIENPLFWLPPALALLTSAAVAIALSAARGSVGPSVE